MFRKTPIGCRPQMVLPNLKVWAHGFMKTEFVENASPFQVACKSRGIKSLNQVHALRQKMLTWSSQNRTKFVWKENNLSSLNFFCIIFLHPPKKFNHCILPIIIKSPTHARVKLSFKNSLGKPAYRGPQSTGRCPQPPGRTGCNGTSAPNGRSPRISQSSWTDPLIFLEFLSREADDYLQILGKNLAILGFTVGGEAAHL